MQKKNQQKTDQAQALQAPALHQIKNKNFKDQVVNTKFVGMLFIALTLTSTAMPRWTELHFAAWNGNIKEVETLIARHDTDINAIGDSNRTPLHYAAIWDKTECAELLLINGANIEAKDIDGATPLHLAAYWGSPNCVELLLQHGANFKEKTNDSRTAKTLAKQKGYQNIIDLLNNRQQKQSTINAELSGLELQELENFIAKTNQPN